jgi:hypothetical protein
MFTVQVVMVFFSPNTAVSTEYLGTVLSFHVLFKSLFIFPLRWGDTVPVSLSLLMGTAFVRRIEDGRGTLVE